MAQVDYKFVQFAGQVAHWDTRGEERLVDRATVGKAISSYSAVVTSIVLENGWFVIVAGEHEYRVPVANVRSARR